MKKTVLMGLSALALLACSSESGQYDRLDMLQSDAGFASPQPVVVQEAHTEIVNGRERISKTSATDQSGSPTDTAQSYLAYRYGYGLVMPSASIKTTADKHMQICRDAGASLCQVTGSNTNSYSTEDIRANLSLRAQPEWLQQFVSGMKADMTEVDGRIQNENTSVEDLTRSILDTDARLKAQKTLRTRLENLLETRDAKLPDLLALERELARVQAEIESATANLKALRARVSMSIVNINYTSEQVAVSRSSVSAIGYAVKDFVRIVSEGLASVIRFVAALLPWMLFIIIPGLFLLRWFWRRRTSIKPKKDMLS